MNNCSSSRHLPLILIWKESTRPFTALNKDHEQTLNYKKIVTSFSSSRFDRTLTDCVQSKNSRNRVKLDEILSTIKKHLNRSSEVQHRHTVYLWKKIPPM